MAVPVRPHPVGGDRTHPAEVAEKVEAMGVRGLEGAGFAVQIDRGPEGRVAAAFRDGDPALEVRLRPRLFDDGGKGRWEIEAAVLSAYEAESLALGVLDADDAGKRFRLSVLDAALGSPEGARQIAALNRGLAAAADAAFVAAGRRANRDARQSREAPGGLDLPLLRALRAVAEHDPAGAAARIAAALKGVCDSGILEAVAEDLQRASPGPGGPR